MKKFFTILGGIFAAMIVILIIVIAIAIPRAIKLEHKGAAYIQVAVPKIAKHWNPRELTDRASPGLLSSLRRHKQVDRLFALFRQLGTLRHLGKPKGSVYSGDFPGGGYEAVGNYTVQAEFAKGAATIDIQLYRTGGSWQINGFYINSSVLLPALEKK
ncbi:MAG: hypothetical protein ACYCUV_06260 [Phycisphaerae bacterium]